MSLRPGTPIQLTPDFARNLDLSVDMTHWVGRVAVYEPLEGEDPDQVLAVADSEFLDQLDGAQLAAHLSEEGPIALMMLPATQLQPAEARDTLADTRASLLGYRKRIESYERQTDPDTETSYEADPSYYLIWQFLVSDAFFQLTEAQQRMTQAVVSEVGSYMDHFFDVSVRNWQPDDLEEVCLTLLPQKFFDPPGFYEALPEVLTAYLRIVAKHEGLDTEALTARIEAIAPQIRQAGEDDTKWGPTKRLIAAMDQRGYDPNDEQQMEAFLIKYGEALGISGEAIMAEMVDHPDVSEEDQAGMLSELLSMDDLFGEFDDDLDDLNGSENGKEGH